MFKIPLEMVNMRAFPNHGWRFGMPKAFYISIDDTGKNSLIYIYSPKFGQKYTELRLPNCKAWRIFFHFLSHLDFFRKNEPSQ